MKFAIMTTGIIANTMAATVNALEQVTKYAVASRELSKAEAFAQKWGFEKAYGSYEEMLSDPEVELVYVASPHSHHYEHAKMCLEHGKHVLLEKSFTVNASQAEELIQLAEQKKLLLAEAIWTRYMPSRKLINDLIAEGTIGKVVSLTANLCYELKDKARLNDPALAGGALLDVGVYPINFALMVCGNHVKKMTSHAVLSPQGVDWTNSITLEFDDGVLAVLHSSMLTNSDRLGIIYGENGYIEVQNINNCEEIRVFDSKYQLVKTVAVPKQISGYEYEVLSCIKAIEEGRTSCEEMPHKDTLYVMRLMDQCRKEWGVEYPCE